MPTWVTSYLPAQFSGAPVLIAGLVALLGLLLWSAGVRVARPISASIAGAVMAGIAASVLPAVFGISIEIAALIGLVIGMVIGALALRVLQGGILAACLGLLAAGGYYAWQAPRWATPPVHATATTQVAAPSLAGSASVQTAAAQSLLPALPPGWREQALAQAHDYLARWQAIPGGLRQSMLAIGLGVALLAILIAWQTPRSTTWIVSAALGTMLLIAGGLMLLSLYVPQYERLIPTDLKTRALVVVITMAVGMILQRAVFWPGKKKSPKEIDRTAETAPAV